MFTPLEVTLCIRTERSQGYERESSDSAWRRFACSSSFRAASRVASCALSEAARLSSDRVAATASAPHAARTPAAAVSGPVAAASSGALSAAMRSKSSRNPSNCASISALAARGRTLSRFGPNHLAQSRFNRPRQVQTRLPGGSMLLAQRLPLGICAFLRRRRSDRPEILARQPKAGALDFHPALCLSRCHE